MGDCENFRTRRRRRVRKQEIFADVLDGPYAMVLLLSNLQRQACMRENDSLFPISESPFAITMEGGENEDGAERGKRSAALGK